MRNAAIAVVSILSALAGTTCAADENATFSAGTFTTQRSDAQAYMQPAPALSERQREIFFRGDAHFNRPWVIFGLSGGDWGLVPTFIADRCDADMAGRGRSSRDCARSD